MGSPSRTRLQSRRHFSCWGPSLPWLLQPQSLSPLLLLSPMLMLIPGTATDTVATDGAATTDLMATMATTERDLQTPSQRPLLPLTPTLTLMLGTATMATDTEDMDMAATTGLMVTTATMERDQRMLSLLPSLQLMLWLTPLQMLMPGTATTATVDTATVDTATGDTAATTVHMDMGVTGEVTGAKQTNRVDSSSDCDFPSTYSQYFQSLRLVWAAGVLLVG